MLVIAMCFVFLVNLAGGKLFHEESKIVIRPSNGAKDFGYSVLIRDFRGIPELVVGAPTSKSTHDAHEGLGNTGAIYKCPIDIKSNPKEIKCPSYEFDTEGNTQKTRMIKHYKNEMFLGGALASFNNSSLIICAPRWCNSFTTTKSESHRLVNGLCYVPTSNHPRLLAPLSDIGKQAYSTKGPNAVTLNYFAYGESGFSATVSADQNWLLMGAPGVMQWTGDVVQYVISRGPGNEIRFVEQTMANTLFTDLLHEDSYFGYTVDTGIFDESKKTMGVGGAPRGNGTLGQVLIFELRNARENSRLPIKASLSGHQLGSYFGSSLLVVDLNKDGMDDLLVGAPLFVDKDADDSRYDQGIVYVYINKPKMYKVNLELAGTVTGSRSDGARFGSSIANLGDVDGCDERRHPEIAIGAPWESDGRGAVYIYQFSGDRIEDRPVQVISPEMRGFGYSISKGLDVDGNGCNDVIIGAVDSSAAVLYRCSRSLCVEAEIRVPGSMDLPENTTEFRAEFCVWARPTSQTPARISIGLVVELTLDQGSGRAVLSDSEYRYTEHVETGTVRCKEKQVYINRNEDLTSSIPITMTISADSGYPPKDRSLGPGVRIGDTSKLKAFADIRLTRDCGEDMICQPDLQMDVQPLSKTLIPGSHDRFGCTVSVRNDGEPAYESCLNITVPHELLRVPSDCSLQGNVLQCKLPRPFLRRAEVNWTVEMASSASMEKQEVYMKIVLLDNCREKSRERDEEIVIEVRPESNITVIGKALQDSVNISRQALAEGLNVDIGHYFSIVNSGPSDISSLQVRLTLPKHMKLTQDIIGCERDINDRNLLNCDWRLEVLGEIIIKLLYRLELGEKGGLLEEGPLETSTNLFVIYDQSNKTLVTLFVLEPASPIWPYCVAAVLGVLLFALLTYGLHRAGFFGRLHRDRLQQLKQNLALGTAGSSDAMSDVLIAESDTDLDLDHISL